MKKIAVICDQLGSIGGRERVVCLTCNDLAEFYDVFCVNLWENSPAYSFSDKVHLVYLHEQKKRLRYALWGSISALRELIKKEGIELILCDGVTAVMETFWAARGLDVKILYREHKGIKVWLEQNSKSIKDLLWQRLVQTLVKKATDRIIVLTEMEADDYVKCFGVPREKVQIIYNYMDDRLFDAPVQYNASSKQLITVGRIVQVKGYEYLINVAGKVFAKHPDWHWDIYGEGEAAYTEEIAGLIKKQGLEKNINLKGASAQVYDLYQNYGIYVMTSRNEGLPMVLLEAKAKKLPLVSFDIHAGPSEIILDGVNGYLVKPFDVDAMAEKINFLIEHPEVRVDFSAHAYDNIDCFRRENVMAKWIDLIDDTLGGDSLPYKDFWARCLPDMGGAVC